MLQFTYLRFHSNLAFEFTKIDVKQPGNKTENKLDETIETPRGEFHD